MDKEYYYSSLISNSSDPWATVSSTSFTWGKEPVIEYDVPALWFKPNKEYVMTNKLDIENSSHSQKEGKMQFTGEKIFTDKSYIMPDIKNVKVIEQYNIRDDVYDGKVVIVEFADGTTEKAVAGKFDTFNFEQGISICITKKLISMKAKGADQSSTAIYNKIINHALKVYDAARAEFNAELTKKSAEEKRQRKIAEKKAKKKAKREAAEREKQIEIQKEAYLRAMKEFKAND